MTKGQIPVLEMIAVTIILFVSFSLFFPNIAAENRWEDAEVILKGRDIMLTMDRMGGIGLFASDPTTFELFMSRAVPEKNLIYWSEIEGTIQNRVTVACNCTVQQIDDLSSSIGRMRLNGRNIQVDIIGTTLSPIQKSDVLVIFGRKQLGPWKDEILNYMSSGSGVVGIADFSNVDKPDSDYTEIFGIEECDDVLGPGNCGGNGDSELSFIAPTTIYQPTYQTHKLFFHVPIRSIIPPLTPPDPSIPYENPGMPTCVTAGPYFSPLFSFKLIDAEYWICNTSTVYFDTDQNNLADRIVKVNDSFSIGTSNFRMSHIDFNRTFISIKPVFTFEDFRDVRLRVFPADLDSSKILLRDGDYNSGNPIPVVTVNASLPGKAIWGADFISLSPFNHDERLLIASMILSASNKKSNFVPLFGRQIGFLTPYINVVSHDMLEIYQFNLGLAFPF